MRLRWGPQRAMHEWGEQRPWSPADLVERCRLCDPSAECECKGTMNILGFAIFFRKKMKKSEKNLFNYVKNEDELHELQNCT